MAGEASSGDAAFRADGLESIRGWLRSYVDDGRLPGAAVLIARNGRIALFQGYGHKSVESRAPIERDTIYRIYSMTKPVTAAAAMALIEDGALSLDAPVARYIPAFERLTVNRCGAGDRLDARPAERAMTILHLLTHTSGLTYGEGNPGAVARLYERQRTDFGPNDGPLADVVDRLAGIPLLFEPGAAWNYGVSSDVLGRVIEIASGRPLDVFIEERILTPLRMTDTGFRVPDAKLNRLASLYQATPNDRFTLLESAEHTASSQPVTLSGGVGLVSTVDDYFRFAEVLRRGGTLEGVKILTESSVRLMTTNHLPHDLAVMGQATFNETTTDGVGYGLGMSVVADPARTAWRSGRGEFAWGGYASTAFWVDPQHDTTVIFMTQLIPSDRYPIRGEIRALVADALDSL